MVFDPSVYDGINVKAYSAFSASLVGKKESYWTSSGDARAVTVNVRSDVVDTSVSYKRIPS